MEPYHFAALTSYVNAPSMNDLIQHNLKLVQGPLVHFTRYNKLQMHVHDRCSLQYSSRMDRIEMGCATQQYRQKCKVGADGIRTGLSETFLLQGGSNSSPRLTTPLDAARPACPNRTTIKRCRRPKPDRGRSRCAGSLRI